MATTINAANISIGMDIEKLKTGMDATRSEINQIRGVLKSSIPDSEKFRHQLELIEKAYKSGGISAEQYARSVEHLQGKLSKGGGFLGGAAGMARGAIAGFAMGGAASQIRDTIAAVDDLGDAAAKVGVRYNDLLILQKTLVEVGGVTGEQAQGSIAKMVLNLAKARENGGDLERSLKKIGLTSQALASLSAVDAFKAISEQFEKIGDHAEQTKLATELFGKAGIEMVPSLKAAANAVGDMEEHLRNSGMLMSDLQAQQFGHANDMIERFNDHIKGMKQGLAEFAVEAMDAAEKLRGVQDTGGTGGSWYGNLLEEMFSNSDTAYKPSARSQQVVAQENAKQLAAFQMNLAELQKIEELSLVASALEIESKMKQSGNDEFNRFLMDGITDVISELDDSIRASEMARLDAQEKTLKDEERKLSGQVDADRKKRLDDIAPALAAGSREAYKFLQKNNAEIKARERQTKALEETRDEIKKLNEKQLVVASRAR